MSGGSGSFTSDVPGVGDQAAAVATFQDDRRTVAVGHVAVEHDRFLQVEYDGGRRSARGPSEAQDHVAATARMVLSRI
jgi:hypothetical protein